MNLGLYEIVYIALGASALVFICLFVLLKVRQKQEHEQETGIVEKGGVRFTLDDAPVVKQDEKTGELEANVTFQREDLVLKRGFKYVVGEKNKIKAGKYTLLTTEEGMEEFNIRRNGYVRSYNHNSSVILSEGDELTAVNISVILR